MSRLTTSPGRRANTLRIANARARQLDALAARASRPGRRDRSRCRRTRGRSARRLALRAAQHRRDAREQLHQRERLGDVVVGAELEAAHAIELRAARRQHDHRRARRAAPRLPRMRRQHLEAVDVGQHHVEHDEIEARRRARARRRRRRGRRPRPRSPSRSACPRGPCGSTDRPRRPGCASCVPPLGARQADRERRALADRRRDIDACRRAPRCGA